MSLVWRDAHKITNWIKKIFLQATIACPQRPTAVNLAFMGLNSFDNILKVHKEAKLKLGEILSSCEMMDDSTMDCVIENMKLKPPIGKHNFYMLIETSGKKIANGIF